MVHCHIPPSDSCRSLPGRYTLRLTIFLISTVDSVLTYKHNLCFNMRITSAFLLALPAIVAAQQQKPLQDTVQEWFNKAKSFIPGAVTSPIDTATARVAAEKVTLLTKDNWVSTLTPSAVSSFSDAPEEWIVLFSGGNKTCYGRCEPLEKAWNVSLLQIVH